MLNFVDDFLNRTTMYRLVEYYLAALLLIALALSSLGFLSFSPAFLFASTALILFTCLAANVVFASVFEAPVNAESTVITALILALILTPLTSLTDWTGLSFAVWASLLAIAGKYILAIDNKHVFNPAALAVALTSLTLGLSATWWVGSLPLLPFVLAGGLLVVRKTRRVDLAASFTIAALVSAAAFGWLQGANVLNTLVTNVLKTNLLFFAFVMITEPITTPPGQANRVVYGALVGALFHPQFNLAGVYLSPELALLVGNVYSFFVSPKGRRVLTLDEKVPVAPGVYDFVFTPDKPFTFKPGQYVELTLAHKRPDSRGNRRYFTLASSPTETGVRFGVKFYANSSSFKTALGAMAPGEKLVAAQLAGEFTLPRNSNQKLAFIAGGIGVTPFRSMVKYLLDQNERRDITLLYANNQAADIAYQDVFELAREKLGIRTVYALSDLPNVPAGWSGAKGYVSDAMIRAEIPDFAERVFYVSGPHSMVSVVENTLHGMGVPKRHIKTDFFPGFA